MTNDFREMVEGLVSTPSRENPADKERQRRKNVLERQTKAYGEQLLALGVGESTDTPAASDAFSSLADILANAKIAIDNIPDEIVLASTPAKPGRKGKGEETAPEASKADADGL